MDKLSIERISSKVVKTKKDDEKAQKFKDYFDWEENLSRIPSHRLLAILRAEKEGFIRVKIAIDNERTLQKIEDRIIKSNNECSEQIEFAIADSEAKCAVTDIPCSPV